MLHSARKAVRYSIDLLSPADLALLRHAVVLDDDVEGESNVVAWQYAELPPGPTHQLRRTF